MNVVKNVYMYTDVNLQCMNAVQARQKHSKDSVNPGPHQAQCNIEKLGVARRRGYIQYTCTVYMSISKNINSADLNIHVATLQWI